MFFDEIHGGMSLEQDKTDGCGKLTDTDLQRALSDEKQTDIWSGCQGLVGFWQALRACRCSAVTFDFVPYGLSAALCRSVGYTRKTCGRLGSLARQAVFV